MNQKVVIQVENMQPESSLVGIENVYFKLVPPDDDHPNARECPQCWKTTWKCTRECVRCGCDVWLQDELIARQRRKRLLKRRSEIAFIISGVSVLILILSVNYASNWFVILSFFVCLFSLKLATDLDQVVAKL